MQLYASQETKIICHDCGCLHDCDLLKSDAEVRCGRCDARLYDRSYRWFEKTAALTVAGLLLFVISNVFPFLSVELSGVSYSTTLLSGVGAMLAREQYLLGVLVLGAIFIFPLLELLCLSFLLSTYAMQVRIPGQRTALSILVALRPWSMLEIFLLSIIIALVKMSDYFTFDPGPGLYSIFPLVFCLVGANRYFNKHKLWNWILEHNVFYKDASATYAACEQCRALLDTSVLAHHDQCPRCYKKVHVRKQHSFQKALALTISAAILYVPANVYPILYSTRLGETQGDTILSGIANLFESGLWVLALIVFVASILVPVLKILTMSVLLYSVRFRSKRFIKYKTETYRWIEFIGRWSMVDVFVVILLVALVQFGFIADIEAGEAVIAFGAVVILSMLATEAFDQRLLWDVENG